MAYLAPIHQPSSVRHALKLKFFEHDEECLVVAKANRLEFYTLTAHALTLRHAKNVYGKVTMLNQLRVANSPRAHLFVGTDRYMYFTLSWDPQRRQLKTETSYVDQTDKSSRDSQTGDRCLTDPEFKFMTLETYEGVVTVLPIAQTPKKQGDPEEGTLIDPIPSRIPEFFVRSSTFIHTRRPMGPKNEQNDPRLALLYEDAHRKVRLKIRGLRYYSGSSASDPGTVDFQDIPDADYRGEVELGASHLIPVQRPNCGLLILSETSITYYEPSSHETLQRSLDSATIFVTWERIDDQRFILADEYGKLYLLMLESDEERITGWRLDVLGETSRASVLVYLDAGLVFVGSHQGDSQVIRITSEGLQIVQTFPNIAPILDFTIMDMGSRASQGGQTNEYSSGQARLVTGSGAFKDGSLRSVRSGVGLEELGFLGEMENITNLFALATNPQSQFADTLLVSFVDETRAFAFDADGSIEELDQFKGFSLHTNTIHAASIPGGRLLQVIPTSVSLFDVGERGVLSEWIVPNSESITAAVGHQTKLLVTIAGTKLVLIDLQAEKLEVQASREFPSSSQIACIALPRGDMPICVVGFWNSSTISVLSSTSLETIVTESNDESGVSVPRSMVITRLLRDQPSVLFVAMADGNVVTYTIDPINGSLKGRRSVVLGTQQANLRVLPREDGLDNVFATCDHASLIYGSEGRIVYSAVTAENAMCVCPFVTETYPSGAVAIATQHDLRLVIVDEERMTHVQGLAVGETVRRIAYSPQLKAFGLGTIKRTLENGVEIVQSHFKLADEVLFNVLASHPLNENELVESVMRAQLRDGFGKMAERFVVGTAYLDDEHGDSIRGRIIVFEATEDRKLKVIAELAVRGACRCLDMVGDCIVAALIKTVVVYSFEYETPSKPFLTKQASYRTSTAPIDLSVSGNLIAIADLMKSVSLVKFNKGQTGRPDTLEEVGRHFQTTWGTAVAVVDDNTYLESDAEGNLMVLVQDTNGVTADDRRRLQVTSEILLGEMVNRIRPINAPALPDAVVVPKAFLATVEGSIYLFATITPAWRDRLMRLQSNMAAHIDSLGNIPFHKYRAFHNQVREAEEPFRFVDGELVEQFLDCSMDVQNNIVQGLGMDVDEVKGMVEGLRRLR